MSHCLGELKAEPSQQWQVSVFISRMLTVVSQFFGEIADAQRRQGTNRFPMASCSLIEHPPSRLKCIRKWDAPAGSDS